MDWDLEAMLCGMFDFDGDGEFDADEEWIAYQILEDCAKDDSLEDDDFWRDGLGEDDSDEYDSDDDWSFGSNDRQFSRFGSSGTRNTTAPLARSVKEPVERSVGPKPVKEPEEHSAVPKPVKEPKSFGELVAELFAQAFVLMIVEAICAAVFLALFEGGYVGAYLALPVGALGVWLAWTSVKNVYEIIKEYIVQRKC